MLVAHIDGDFTDAVVSVSADNIGDARGSAEYIAGVDRFEPLDLRGLADYSAFGEPIVW